MFKFISGDGLTSTGMVSIQDIRAQLTGVKRFGPGLVGVFVGGTSGIGETTAREFIRYAIKPRVYLVGRSQEQADLLKTEFAQINAESQVNFIKSDVSLLRNVDAVCEEIKAKEEKVNLLVLSAGIMTMKGRDETPEGLDKKLSLHYYSRLRFAQQLLPQLNRAATCPAPALSSVVSVLGAGLEAKVNMEDPSLKTTYTIRACASHAITFNSLAFHKLSVANPAITFIHTAPGGVQTNLFRDMGKWTKMAIESTFWIGSRWAMPVQECGERHVWAATSDNIAKGGFVLVGSDSSVKNNPFLQKLEQDGTEKAVWDHTSEVFDKVCRESGKY